MPDAREWLLVKRDLYFRPDGIGYTGIRDDAGRFTYEEAKSWARDGQGGVTMIKASEAPEFTGACFDDLSRAHLTKQREEMRERCVKARNALVEILSVTDHANVREIARAALLD